MKTEENLIDLNPNEFIQFLREKGINRFYFVRSEENGKVSTSHPELNEIADWIAEDSPDFLNHEGMFFRLSENFDVLLGAFIHKTKRGQAAGGVRLWKYTKISDYLTDGMRLAIGMTRKNALAGLWWGGGKGVIAHADWVDIFEPEIRSEIYSEYGKFMTSLKGCYITAEDVGTNVSDMHNVFKWTRFTTCIPESLGGSGNPSVPTARGVVSGIQAAVDFYNYKNFDELVVAVQGLGNVGRPLIKYLFEKGVKRVIGYDIFTNNIEKAKAEFGAYPFEALLIAKDDTTVFATPCDVFSPCATGAVLNEVTIPLLKAKIVCGAANNQLADPDRDGELISNSGIYYVPDFLTNRMGIVNCANEQYGYIDGDSEVEKHLSTDWEHSIYKRAVEVFAEAASTGINTAKIARDMADTLSEETHPVFGHRGVKIIESLVRSGWEKGNHHI
jgi:glutamate dehydrogenase/leucine dehydrogenase